MSDHCNSLRHAATLLPRLVAHHDDRSSQGAADDALVTVEAPAAPPEDRKSRTHGAECAQAPLPSLPAGFNPYFDLPPV